jgi:hypothetical protein
MLADKAEGCVIVTITVPVQLFASEMVHVYVPALRPFIAGFVPFPDDQEYV